MPWDKSPGGAGWNNSGFGELGPIVAEGLGSFWFHENGAGRIPNETSTPDYAGFASGEYDIFSPTIDLSKFDDSSRWVVKVITTYRFGPNVTGGSGDPSLNIGYRLNSGSFANVESMLDQDDEGATHVSDEPGEAGDPFWLQQVTELPSAVMGEADVQIGYRFKSLGPYTTTDIGPGITGVIVRIEEA